MLHGVEEEESCLLEVWFSCSLVFVLIFNSDLVYFIMSVLNPGVLFVLIYLHREID